MTKCECCNKHLGQYIVKRSVSVPMILPSQSSRPVILEQDVIAKRVFQMLPVEKSKSFPDMNIACKTDSVKLQPHTERLKSFVIPKKILINIDPEVVKCPIQISSENMQTDKFKLCIVCYSKQFDKNMHH